MFPALLLGCLTVPSSQTQTVTLYRGARIADGGYWAVSDTYLDQSDADRPKGGLFTLEGGKGRTVLIKFGDLERIIPAGAKITKATLFLSPSSSDRPQLESVGVVKAPWGEGPNFAISRGAVNPPEPRLAATWKQRRSKSIDWQLAGATGPSDSEPITGVQVEEHDKEIAVSGLANSLQAMRDRWFDNYGFSLTFSGKCEFLSSQAKLGKPKLVVEYTPAVAAAGADLSVQWLDRAGTGDDSVYRATVKNVGDAPAPPFSGQWVVGERAGGKFSINRTLAVGEETVVEMRKGYQRNNADHRAQSIAFRVIPTAAEANSNNDSIEIWEDALAIGFTGAKVQADALQAMARRLNDVYFAQSRFSFATDGVLERIRLVPNQDDADYVIDMAGGPGNLEVMRRIVSSLTGLAPVTGGQRLTFNGQEIPFDDPFAGLSGFGDTRYEGLLPPGIPMLYVPVASPLFDNFPIEPTNLLSGTEVAAINLALNKKGKAREGILWDLPPTIVLRATDMTGKALDGAELAFFQVENGKIPDVPTQTILTKDGGTVLLENRDVTNGSVDSGALHQLKKNPFGNLKSDGANGTILIRAQINGETEWSWLKAWQLSDAYQRGGSNRNATIIDVRFNAPSGPLDRATNLAKGRPLADQEKRLPAQLAALVDDDVSTEVQLGDKSGDWVEIDLGRDRPIGEVQLVLKDGGMPSKFDIQSYSTGQAAPQTDAWVKDLNFEWTKANRGRKDGSIAYRGPMTRARYVRIVNRSGGAAKLAEIRIFALKSE